LRPGDPERKQPIRPVADGNDGLGMDIRRDREFDALRFDDLNGSGNRHETASKRHAAGRSIGGALTFRRIGKQ
jgi:hypothetical protein